MICAVNQAAYLLKRQLETQGEQFLSQGGFTEKLYGARKRGIQPEARNQSSSTAPPSCPKCHQPMKLRTTRTGQNAGKQFWGCRAYPNCKAMLPVRPSDQSDQSD
jgi:restriction system protein